VPEPKPKATEQSGLARSAFETQYRDLHRFLLRRLSSPSEAADLMQDVFLRLLCIRRVDLVRHPRAYVYGIAAHVLHEFAFELKTSESRSIRAFSSSSSKIRPPKPRPRT